MQGFFDLSGIPLPPGVTTANYEVTFEAVNPNYILTNSVGPYLDGSPQPSGTLSAISVPSMSAGSAQTLTVNVANSAANDSDDAIGSEADAAHAGGQRNVERALQPDRPDRLVQLSGSRRAHLYRGHAGAGRERRAHQPEGHARAGRLGCLRSGRFRARRLRRRAERPGHRRKLAAGRRVRRRHCPPGHCR